MEGKRPAGRRERAWWQWLLAVGFFGAAAVVIVLGYVPGLGAGRGTRVVPPREIRVPQDMEPAASLPAAPGSLAGANVLLVTFDTTRADRVGCYGNDRIDTPALDRLADEGVLFSRAIAPAPTTLPSHCSMMTGLYPYRHGARANNSFRLADEHVTLAEILSERGYSTAAMVSAVILDDQFGLDQGFATYDDDLERSDELELIDIAQRPGDETGDRAREWLREHAADPFFLWVHLYDPHYPYEAPEPYGSRYALAYDGEIAFADAQLGRLLALLDELQLADRTLVIAAGDHGEGLGQHEEFFHATLIYESTLHVPLIMRCGDRLGRGLHVDGKVSLVDLMPTTLELLGVEAPPDLDGVSLTEPPSADRPIFVETLQGLADYGWAALLGVHQGPMKFIYGPEVELYDLARDPHEHHDLSGDNPRLVAALEGRLRGYFGDDLEEAGSAAPTHQMSAEDLAKMQSLGYMAGGDGALPPPRARPHPRKMMPLLSRVNAALMLEEQESLDVTVAALEAIAEEEPEFAAVFSHLGDAYRKQGHLDLAEEAYARFLELRPTDVQPLMMLAGVKMAQKQFDAAVTLFREALDRSPDNFRALAALGRALLDQGEYEEASDILLRALEVRPQDEELPDKLVDTMVLVDRLDEALAALEAQLADRPNLPMVRNALARGYAVRGRVEEAIEVLREGLSLAPQRHELANNLAFILVTHPDPDLRQPVEAAVMMEQVCQRTEYSEPQYMHTLSMVYAALRRVDEALVMAERARSVALASDDPAVRRTAQGIGLSIQHYREMKEEGVRPPIEPGRERTAAEDAGEDTDADEQAGAQPSAPTGGGDGEQASDGGE